MEMRRRRPRPMHEETEESRARSLEKKTGYGLEQVQQEYPAAHVEAWAEDEHRIGLHPVNRMIWVRCGRTTHCGSQLEVSMAMVRLALFIQRLGKLTGGLCRFSIAKSLVASCSILPSILNWARESG